MDKVISARLDEEAIAQMELVTRRLRITKKQFLEDAIRDHARHLAENDQFDVWSHSFGAWRRGRERPATTVAKAREKCRKSFERHQE